MVRALVGIGNDLDVDGVSFKDAKNVLTLDGGDWGTTLWLC